MITIHRNNVMPKQRSKRIEGRLYTRTRGGLPRYYADFRDFADVGGRQEPLRPKGCRVATSDKKVAVALAKTRLAALKRTRTRANGGPPRERTFDALVPAHLKAKAAAGKVTKQWLGNVTVHLETAAMYFGPGEDLAKISPLQVDAYASWLLKQPNGRGGTLSPGSIHQYLTSLGQLFRRAIHWELLASTRAPRKSHRPLGC